MASTPEAFMRCQNQTLNNQMSPIQPMITLTSRNTGTPFTLRATAAALLLDLLCQNIVVFPVVPVVALVAGTATFPYTSSGIRTRPSPT